MLISASKERGECVPIKDLTDNSRDEALHLGYPCIARLYKGDAKTDPKRPGKDRETFRIEFQKPYDTPEMKAAWSRIYCPEGKDPASLDWVFLFGNTPDEVFPTWWEEWTKTAMLHRCDGETQKRRYVKDTGKYSNTPVSCECVGKEKPPCQRVGRLNLWLPLLMHETGIKGYVALSTHSLNDLVHIHETVKAFFRDYGDISTVPLVFGRKPESISTPMNGERVTTVKSLLYLNVMPHYVKLTMAAALSEGHAGLGLGTGHRTPALPAPKPPPATPLKDALWTDATKDRAAMWINRNFGVDAAKVIAQFKKPFEDFDTVEAWQVAVKAFLVDSELPLIARTVEVLGGSTITGFKVVTTLTPLQINGGASALERLLGENRDVFVDRYNPSDWKVGGTYTLHPPLWVEWKLQEGTRIVTGLSFDPPHAPDTAPQQVQDDNVTEGDFEEVDTHA